MREWMGGCLEMAEMEGDGLVDAGQMDTWVCVCDSEVQGGWVMDRWMST